MATPSYGTPRNIKVGGGRRMAQLRAELYNALNTPIFTGA